VDEPHLARLADALQVSKPPCSEQLGAVQNVVVEAAEKKQAAARSACTTFAGIAVDDNDILRIF